MQVLLINFEVSTIIGHPLFFEFYEKSEKMGYQQKDK
jgi:hypothetical protein